MAHDGETPGIERAAAGGSNLTHRVTDAAGAVVALRRPPVGLDLATAHDVDREWRIISTLHAENAVPGAQVAIHTLDLAEVGLADLGRHDGYVHRQLKRWMSQVQRGAVRDTTLIEQLHGTLTAVVPPERASPALAHGDYRFDNVVLTDEFSMAAVLDRELCTTGDPIADFVWSLQYWVEPNDDTISWLPDPPTTADSFPRRSEVTERYANATGFDLSDLPFYEAFSWWKQACIVEGVLARRHAGSHGGIGASGVGDRRARRRDARSGPSAARPARMTKGYAMEIDIAVVGSANLDLVVEVGHVPLVGETVLGGDLRRVPGGKGANQAVAAARLGRQVAMVGRLGDDDAGVALRTALDEAAVDTSRLLTTPDTPNGVALIAVAADGDNAIVVSPGANGRVTVADVSRAGPVLEEAAVVLLQLEIPIEAVTEAASLARATVVLNPAPAPDGPLPAALLDAASVLVPNQTELASLAGHDGPVDPATAAALVHQLGCRAAVVTLGAGGALVVEGERSAHVEAPEVRPVDTTAAGDAFCGALADALVADATLLEAARWAVRVGAATTLRPGAQPSLPTGAEVDSLLA